MASLKNHTPTNRSSNCPELIGPNPKLDSDRISKAGGGGKRDEVASKVGSPTKEEGRGGEDGGDY